MMTTSQIGTLIFLFNIFKYKYYIFRLNYRYTVAILIAFAIIVSHRQFSESVIKCWVPAFFTPNYESYANQVCWISNTYYVNQSHNVPNSDETRKSGEIKYYQWIPVNKILLNIDSIEFFIFNS